MRPINGQELHSTLHQLATNYELRAKTQYERKTLHVLAISYASCIVMARTSTRNSNHAETARHLGLHALVFLFLLLLIVMGQSVTLAVEDSFVGSIAFM